MAVRAGMDRLVELADTDPMLKAALERLAMARGISARDVPKVHMLALAEVANTLVEVTVRAAKYRRWWRRLIRRRPQEGRVHGT